MTETMRLVPATTGAVTIEVRMDGGEVVVELSPDGRLASIVTIDRSNTPAPTTVT